MSVSVNIRQRRIIIIIIIIKSRHGTVGLFVD